MNRRFRLVAHHARCRFSDVIDMKTHRSVGRLFCFPDTPDCPWYAQNTRTVCGPFDSRAEALDALLPGVTPDEVLVV